MPSSISMSWLYILIACNRVSYFLNFCQFDVVHAHKVTDLFLRFSKFKSGCVFLVCVWRGIIAIINSNGDSVSPRNIPLWIFVSAMIFLPAVNFTLQVFMVFSVKFMTSSNIFYILRQFIIQLCGTISYAFLYCNPGHS